MCHIILKLTCLVNIIKYQTLRLDLILSYFKLYTKDMNVKIPNLKKLLYLFLSIMYHNAAAVGVASQYVATRHNCV